MGQMQRHDRYGTVDYLPHLAPFTCQVRISEPCTDAALALSELELRHHFSKHIKGFNADFAWSVK
jgi:hypothetical protein